MKLKTTVYFFLAVLGIYLSACQKEVSDDGSSIPVPPVTTDSSYLSKMLIIDNDGAGTIDTFETFTYVYDNLKRVSQLLDSSEDNSSNTLLPFHTTQYYYNGNDTMPFKAVTYAYSAGFIDTTTHYYTYNTSGKVVADSGIKRYSTADFEKDIRTYQYNGSTIFGMRTITSINQGSTSVSVEKDTAQVDMNGNIIQNVKNRDFETVHSTITWDNHPSPFARISNFQTFFILPIGETFFYEMPKKNNRLHANEITTDNSSGTIMHVYDDDLDGTYTYNIAGYPTQILIPDSSIPGAYEKTVFIYKAF